MCCQIDLNTKSEAAHFLGKGEPTILPKTQDNIPSANIRYTGEAMSLFDKIKAYFTAR